MLIIKNNILLENIMSRMKITRVCREPTVISTRSNVAINVEKHYIAKCDGDGEKSRRNGAAPDRSEHSDVQ